MSKTLRLEPKCGRFVARFKHRPETRNLEFDLFEPNIKRLSLVLTKTKPFDFFTERLPVLSSRGDRIRTYDPLVPNRFKMILKIAVFSMFSAGFASLQTHA
jgi:hypothetical protein